jgi:hypothetical protein
MGSLAVLVEMELILSELLAPAAAAAEAAEHHQRLDRIRAGPAGTVDYMAAAVDPVAAQIQQRATVARAVRVQY